jgi:hypothetical protein
MRTVPSAWTALETARERQVALLIHVYVKRDPPGSNQVGRVTVPSGWGSWTYSVGFQGNVSFTDLHDYAGQGSLINRTYVPAAIEFDASQAFRNESTSLDPHDLTLIVDPTIDPFANYVNRTWPLTFGIVIYKVHRNSAGSGVATVDNGSGTQIPCADVAFIGYLDADDTLEVNSAGLEVTIAGGKLKYETKWNHITKVFDRMVPRPVFSIDCPKMVFSTGPASVACNADPAYVQIDGIVSSANGCVISALEWGAQATGWFAQGYISYTATDPISGLDFGFMYNVRASAQRVSGSVTYQDLTLEMFPALMTVGTAVSAFGGCDRTVATCTTKHIPAGSEPAPAGSFTPGSIEVALQLANTTTNATRAYVYITATALWIVYDGTDQNQIVGEEINSTIWDPTWVAGTGATIITNPKYSLSVGAGPPAQSGYKTIVTNTGSGGANAILHQSPNANNGYTAIIACRGGAGIFDFIVGWTANAGQPIALGNLQNFGGTNIPVDHPSLETTQ